MARTRRRPGTAPAAFRFTPAPFRPAAPPLSTFVSFCTSERLGFLYAAAVLTTTLEGFITGNRTELIQRCRAKVAGRSSPPPTPSEIDHGVPILLDQIVTQLQDPQPDTRDILSSASQHGRDLFVQGLT